MDETTSEPQITNLSRSKRLLFSILLLAGGLLIGLLIVELGLRVVGYSSPEFYTPDESLGYKLIPNMSGQYRKEGQSFVEINRDGFRDVEHTVSKPEGIIRVAVIGDSYVEAFQVDRDESFANFMRTEVEDCSRAKIEVLRFGVSGYGTAQELIMLRENVMKYSPDVVVLLMTMNNDVSDNSRVFKTIAIPYFEYRDGKLVLDDSFRSDRSFMVKNSMLARLGLTLRNNLRFVQAIGEIQVALKYRYRRWRENEPTTGGGGQTQVQTVAPQFEPGLDIQVYRPPTDENWETAWRVTEGLIDLMNTEITQRNAKFVVVTGSNGAQVLPELAGRRFFSQSLKVDDLFYPDRRISEYCKTHSIPVITLAPFLADYAEREQKTLHGFGPNLGYGHWNQLGHRVAGTAIGQQMCRIIAP